MDDKTKRNRQRERGLNRCFSWPPPGQLPIDFFAMRDEDLGPSPFHVVDVAYTMLSVWLEFRSV